MLMSYLGTTKTLLNTPVVKLVKPSVWSLRLPALITGAITVWMFGLLLYRLSGAFAAIAGSFLLALDPSFLTTIVFDWGPVALQHFLLVAGVLAIYIASATVGFAAHAGRWLPVFRTRLVG